MDLTGMRAFPTRSWAAIWLVCQMLTSLAPVLGSCCPTRAATVEARSADERLPDSSCPMHRPNRLASSALTEAQEHPACPMHRHHGKTGACCRMTSGCEPHEMPVVVPAVLAEAPVFGPVPSTSTPIRPGSDRPAALAFTPDLPPPRA
jgi:hypothetical protein